MNIYLLLLVLVVSIAASSCTSTSTTSVSNAPMTGSYASVDVQDSDVLACATYAVSVQEPRGTVQLIDILEAQRQVVAGMNYKLKLSIIKNGIKEIVNAVVWSKLDGTKEVTDWRK